jgi:hypothetical protein
MGRYFDFFATKQDSLDLLLVLEKKSPLFYARWGYYPAREAPTYHTASELSDLGIVIRPHKGANRYIIFPEPVSLEFREVHRNSGKTDYVTTPPKGAPWVWFSSGGRYGEECLITGTVETGMTDRIGLRFFDRFCRAIRARFTRAERPRRVNCVGRISYVGPEALQLLLGGMRCTDSMSSPRLLDFKVARGWRPEKPRRTPIRLSESRDKTPPALER